MTEAKLAPNLPDWMVEHANRYLSSGGTDGHMYTMTQPGRPNRPEACFRGEESQGRSRDGG
jgi:hypothetical protein